MRLILPLYCLLFLTLTTAVFSEDSRTLLAKGTYKQAIDYAKTSSDIDDKVAACQASLILKGHYGEKENYVQLVDEIVATCTAAIALQPDHIPARLMMAMAYGMKAKVLSQASHAKEAKKILEGLLRENPQNSNIQGSFASWHAEIARKGLMARSVLGASPKQARALFSRAFAQPVDNLALKLEYLKFLAHEKDYGAAKNLYNQMMDTPVKQAFDAVLKQSATEIMRAVETKNRKAIKAAIKKAAPFS